MWSCLGALQLNDVHIVKKNLETFLKYEKNGYAPLRIGNRWIIQTFLGIKSKKLYPRYYEDKRGIFVSDSNTLLIVAFYHYYLKTKNTKFIKRNMSKIRKILDTVSEFADQTLLINEDYYSTWMDGIKKKGKIFYSNILYYLAVKYYVALCAKIKIKQKKYTQNFLRDLAINIRKIFWNGEYFTDWAGNNDQNYFATFANLIAIYFNFATKKEKNSILDFISKNKIIKEDGRIKKSYPDYSNKYVSPLLTLMGLKGYCTRITYPWMSFFYFLCLKKEKKETAYTKKALKNLCIRIIKERDIYECYDKNLKPYKTFYYRAEHPFAWACSFGVLLLK